MSFTKSIVSYIIKILLVFVILLSQVELQAQSVKDFDKNFAKAKELYDQGKFLPAMEAFKPLMLTNKSNKNQFDAHYYFSLSAYQVKDYSAVIKTVNNLYDLAPNFTKIDELSQILSKVYFEKGYFSLAVNTNQKITNTTIFSQALESEKLFVNKSLNIDTLKTLYAKFPKDPQVTLVYNEYLAVQAQKAKAKNANNFKIAGVFPFNVNAIKYDAINRDNQFVLDLYQGMKMGVEALATKGINVELTAYDIDKDTIRLKSTFSSNEFKNTNLVVGPIFNSQMPIAAKILAKNNIAVVNPLSDNLKALNKNKNALLFKSSQYTQALKTAEFIYQNFENKTTLVVYGKSSRDTAFARVFRDKYKELGGNVFIYKQVDKFNSTNLTKLLGKDTLLNASSLVVFNSEQMVASNVVTAVAIHNTNTPVFTYSDWLDFTNINFDQYEKYNFHFMYPGYVDFENEAAKAFKSQYLEKVNLFPSEYAYWGYELMLYYGNLLQKYGSEFYTKLSEIPVMEGNVIENHFYGLGQDNQVVPIVKFEKSKLVRVGF